LTSTCFENPCVGGSIPPQATSFAGRSSQKCYVFLPHGFANTAAQNLWFVPQHRSATKRFTCTLDRQVKSNIDYAEEAVC